MRTVAVIEKNKCNFDKMEEFALPLLYREHEPNASKELKQKLNDYIWSVIGPYITFTEIEDDQDIMTTICNQMTKCFPDKKADDFYYHTESSYSCPKKFLEIIHCQPLWKGYEDAQPENMNNVGCLFSLKHTVIENTCVIIGNKYDLSAPYFTSIDNLTKEDILRVVRRRFFFTAVLIKEDSMVKYYYQNPSYLVSQVFGLEATDKIEKLSFSHLKYNLLYYFRQDKSLYVNKIATRINASYRVHGDILVLHEMEENLFTNLSIREAKRINVLSYGRLYDRQLKDEENHVIPTFELNEKGEEEQKKKMPFWSRFIIIDNRMLNWQKNKNKCINCDCEIVKPIICQRCYRVKYCSEKCEKEFGSYHYDECIHPDYH